MSELARFLEPRIERLVHRWTEQVADHLAPGVLPEPVLRNHVVDVLRELVASLDRGTVPETIVYAREHGKQRYQVGFRLEALVREYGLLRSLVFDLAAEANLAKPLEELRLLTDFIAAAITEGVTEYDEQRARSEQGFTRALTEARLMSDSALTAGSVGTFTWDIASDRLYGDTSFARLFRIQLDASGAAPIADYANALHPDDREPTLAAVDRSVQEGGLYEAEYRIVTGERERWAVARGRVDRDEAGRPQRLLGVVMDITERKEIEKAQRALTARLATALAAGGLGTFEWDLRTDTLQLDDRSRAIFAFAPDEDATSAAVFARIDLVDRARVQSETEAGIASRPRISSEYRLALPDHPPITVLSFGEFLRGPDGRAERMIGVFRDVTEERLAAEHLRRSEERVRWIVEASGAGMWDLDVASGGIEGDARTVELMGLPLGSSFSLATALDGLPVTEDRERVADAVNDALAGKNQGRYQIEFRTGGQHGAPQRWVESRAQSAFDAQGHALRLAGVMMDITARKTADDERERMLRLESQARQQAEETSRLKDDFISTVSHELRTPLTSMLGWTQMLRAGTLVPAQQHKALETIERNAKAQAQLIDDLLDMSRILAGKMHVEVSTVNVATVVEAALSTVQPAAEAKGIRLQPVLDPHGLVRGDAQRLQQVLWNLLSNAVKFTPKGGRVQTTVRCLDSSVEIVVADTGKGIDPRFLPHVFDRFRQADGSITRTHGGHGLGLTIVRQVVELHGGTVSVTSEGEGHGASFTVRLPLAASRGLEAGLLSRSTSSGPPAGVTPHEALVGLRLLLVDDEPDTRDFLTFLLELQGARVRQAASAAEARRLFAEELPDVLVSDIGMPDENGYAFLASIRSLPPLDGGQVPALALTAYARSEDRTRALRAGFSNHVAKPVEPQELFAAVAALVRRPSGGSTR